MTATDGHPPAHGSDICDCGHGPISHGLGGTACSGCGCREWRKLVVPDSPTLRDRMHAGYLAAELFALESWCDATRVVDDRSKDARAHGASSALGRAIMNRDMWHMEAERCGAVAGALAKMTP